MSNNLTEEELQRYHRIVEYTNNFNSIELADYENTIFGTLSKKERLQLEYRRTREYLKNNPELYAKYLDNIIEIEKMMKVLNFDSTLEEDIYKKIVSIQIDTKQSIRLLSIIYSLKKDLEYIDFYRRTTKNKHIR